jgi:hypothetical protein
MTKYRLIALVVLATAVLLTTGALAFQPPGPSRRATSFDRAHASTWGEVFANPRPIRVETLDTGIVHFPKELLLSGDHPAMDAFTDDGSPLRVFAHLVRHEQRGDVLIDTGLDDIYATQPLGHMRGVGRLVMGLLGLSFSTMPRRCQRLTSHFRSIPVQRSSMTLATDSTTAWSMTPESSASSTSPTR